MRLRGMERRCAGVVDAVDAASVEDVIITHLHYDHAGTLGNFPRARFHIQVTEMQFTTGRWMLDDVERQAYSADHVAELVHRLFEKRVIFHHENGEIAPGVTVHRMPGHTMGMQSVRVPTRRGWVLFAICWSRDDLLVSYRKFESLADSEDHVVPGHDPLVRSLYPAAGNPLGTDAVRLDESPLKSLREVFPEH